MQASWPFLRMDTLSHEPLGALYPMHMGLAALISGQVRMSHSVLASISVEASDLTREGREKSRGFVALCQKLTCQTGEQEDRGRPRGRGANQRGQGRGAGRGWQTRLDRTQAPGQGSGPQAATGPRYHGLDITSR